MKGNDFLTQGTLLNLLSANTFVSNRIHDAKIQFCAKKLGILCPIFLVIV